MKQVFKDYLVLQEKYFDKATLTKEEKKQKHSALMQWKRDKYEEMPNFEETIDFMKAHSNLLFVEPFFDKMILPHLLECEKNNDYTALKLLLEITSDKNNTTLDRCIDNATDYFSIPSLKKALTQFPDHKPILSKLFGNLSTGFSFAIHELPLGILDFDYEADIADLHLMRELAEKLDILTDKLELHIQFLETIYSAYETYFLNHDEYENFEEYLNKHNISYFDEDGYIL